MVIYCCNIVAYNKNAPVPRSRAIFQHLLGLIVAVVVLQCGASLAMAVHDGLHEAVHHHEDKEDHDCPVVQLAHGFWDAPPAPDFAIPRPPMRPEEKALSITTRWVPALILSISVLEHAPPRTGV